MSEHARLEARPSDRVGRLSLVPTCEPAASRTQPIAWRDASARVAACARRGGDAVTVALVGLVGLDAVRRCHGRAAADTARHVIAERVARACARRFVVAVDDDTLLVAGSASHFRADDAGRLLDAVGDAIDVDGAHVCVLAAVGLATGPARSADEVLSRADAHLRDARRLGAGTVRRTGADDATGAAPDPVARAGAHLLDAMRCGEIEVHFQPIVELSTGRIAALEALVRWRSPVLGAVPPPTVVAAAEAVGLSHELGQLVCDTALDLVHRARRRGRPQLRVAVNASPVQLAHPGFVARVLAGLDARALPGTALEVELTETSAITDVDGVVRHLDQLRAAGVTVVLDDFGTGHANLDALRSLPIDVVKIDRRFVAGLPDDPVDRGLVRHVLEVAQELGVEVVAEGVETVAQHAELRRAGCRFGQGFLYARPRPAADALEPLAIRPAELDRDVPVRRRPRATEASLERRRRMRDDAARRGATAAAVLHHLPAGALVVDGAGRLLLANARAAELLGITGRPVPGIAMIDHVHGDDRLAAAQAFAALLGGVEIEPVAVRIGPHDRPVTIHAVNCLEVDGVRGVVLGLCESDGAYDAPRG